MMCAVVEVVEEEALADCLQCLAVTASLGGGMGSHGSKDRFVFSVSCQLKRGSLNLGSDLS